MTRIAIYSHVTREQARSETIASLEAVGLKPDVVRVQTESPQQRHNRRNAHAALREAFDGSPVLVLEDDVIPAETLPAWLDYLAEHEDHVTTLYAPVGKFYQGAIRKVVESGELPRASSIEWLPKLQGWYGAQAVWIPVGECEAILADKRFQLHEHEPLGPWDHAIRQHLIDRNRRMKVTVPNLVQHRRYASVMNREPTVRSRSPIFDPVAPPPA